MSARSLLGSDHEDISARKPYDLIDEPSGSDYQGLISGARGQCDSGMLMVRPDALSPSGQAVVDRLRPYVRAETPSSGGGAMIRFELNADSAGVLSGAADRLYAWQHPDLPEDLCLLRRDGSPWLVSLASERLGHVELTAFEKLLLGRTAPGLPHALAHQAARDAILAVFERRLEDAVLPLVEELVGYSRGLVDEGRDGVVEAVGEWLESTEPVRSEVALELIARLELDEFGEEVAELRQLAEAGRIVEPDVFRSNPVLRARWRARHLRQLDRTLSVLGISGTSESA